MGVDNKWYNEKITVQRDQNIQLKKLVLGNRLCHCIIFMIVQTCNSPKMACMVFKGQVNQLNFKHTSVQ